ncbi:MAG: amidohydrolase family protein [Armatimonadia bacterium]|nr:amidohydrolase family protein [Armatimonadia bacterium]
MTRAEISSLLDALPVVSSHCHHAGADHHAGLTLNGLLGSSYAGWMAQPPAETHEARAAFVDRLATNTYFTWLSHAVDELYGRGPIEPGSWDAIDAAIGEAHTDPEHHYRLLGEHCRYRFAVQDCYWDRGHDHGRPDLFRPTYRIDSWVSCFAPGVIDHDGNDLWADLGLEAGSLVDYLDLLDDHIAAAKARGAVALKSALAYERPVSFDRPLAAPAQRAFKARPDAVSSDDVLAFGDVVFHHCCRAAQREGLPFQIHLGLGQISGSRPMLFEPVIRAYPGVTFDLFHAGYPWTGESAGLLHNYPNVVADLCWLPLISTTAAVRALHEYLDVAGSSERILWGDDTWTGEEAYGALVAWRHVVATVLTERLEWGLLRESHLEPLAEKLMWRNGAAVFGG